MEDKLPENFTYLSEGVKIESSHRKFLIEDMDLYSDCLRGDLARAHHQFLRLTTIVMEHIESIILVLGPGYPRLVRWIRCHRVECRSNLPRFITGA
jgi:hypothetical protein